MPNILVAENNRRIAEVVSRFLVKKGFRVDLAEDGPGAIRFLASGAYDILLVNRELPVMNGIELCRRVRGSATGATVPIILMSEAIKTAAELDDVRRELQLSVILPKPFTSDILSAALSLAVPSQSTPPGAINAELPPPRAPEGDPLQLTGDLSRLPFEKVLLVIMKRKGTGVLTVDAGRGLRRFFFIGGSAAGVEVAPGDEDFGAYLARRRLIEPAELREYARRKRDGKDPRDLFVKMGCLTPVQLEEENRRFLHDRLVECFSFRSGSILFELGPSILRTLDAASAFMPSIFLRGFKLPQFSSRVHSFLEQKKAAFPGRAGEFYEYQGHLAAEADDAGLFDRIDGSRTCGDLIGSTDDEDAAAILFTLDYLGVLSYSDRPERAGVPAPFPIRERIARRAVQETFEDLGSELGALADEVGELAPAGPSAIAAPAEPSPLEQDLKRKWEAVKGKNYYEMFGMTPRTFSFDKLKKAYFDYTRTYGPDKFFASSSEIMSLAEELLSTISNAFETLSNVVSKENYDELIASEEQAPAGTDDKQFYEQIQFQSGKVFLDEGQFASAEKAFQNCVNIDANKPEYLAYLALAVYHNPANKGAAGTKRARDLVNKSLQLGKLSIAYALKGLIYLDEGGINFAEAEFNKALRLNPNNKTALKMLETIRQKREDEKKGIFQRIFK